MPSLHSWCILVTCWKQSAWHLIQFIGRFSCACLSTVSSWLNKAKDRHHHSYFCFVGNTSWSRVTCSQSCGFWNNYRVQYEICRRIFWTTLTVTELSILWILVTGVADIWSIHQSQLYLNMPSTLIIWPEILTCQLTSIVGIFGNDDDTCCTFLMLPVD